MVAEIHIGARSVVQHDVLGELAVDLKQEEWKRPIYPEGAPEADLLDGEIRGTPLAWQMGAAARDRDEETSPSIATT